MKNHVLFAAILLILPTVSHASGKETSSKCPTRLGVEKYFACMEESRPGDQPFDANHLPDQHMRYVIEVRTGCDAASLSNESYAACLNKFMQERHVIGKSDCWKIEEPEAFDKCLAKAEKPADSGRANKVADATPVPE